MEFGFTEEGDKLRKEVHDFYANELPEDYNPALVGLIDGYRPCDFGNTEGLISFSHELQRKVGAKGYLTAGWPKEYGGMGLSPIEHGILTEEQSYWSINWPNFNGLNLAGPVILTFGTKEQKKKFIPPIARGEVLYFECLTEPEAGSDEANMQLRAVPEGDDFVFNGQKTFISGSSKPNWLYTLARTKDIIPKQKGLSLFIIPGDAPGITYRPLPTLGGSMQHDIFFDNVRVSRDNLIGKINEGFIYNLAAFGRTRADGVHLEFSKGNWMLDAKRGMERWVQYCRQETKDGKPLIKDQQVRKALAKMTIEKEIFWLTQWYAIWRRTQKETVGPQTYNLNNFYRKEMIGATFNRIMNMTGLYGQLKPSSKWAKFSGSVQRSWEFSRSFHGGGTPEIQKVIIADRGLGLPRIPRKFNTMITQAIKEEKQKV